MEYKVTRVTDQQDELYHYGVLGMKWGVRRATKQLSNASTKADRDKAVAKLQKHREKGTVKVEKLQKQRIKLKDKYDVKVTKQEKAGAKLTQKAAILERRAYRPLTSQRRAERLLFKSRKLKAEANYLTAKAQEARSKIEKNEKMTETFQRQIKNIDATLVNKGKRYVAD